MKHIITLLVLASLAYSSGTYFFTAKVTLRENGEITKEAWMQSKPYYSMTQCEGESLKNLKKYRKQEIQLNSRFKGREFTFSNFGCLTESELDEKVNNARMNNLMR